MSKRFKDKTCIYCLTNPSIRSGDHVFAREFFLEARRANLPKVPACDNCNNDKSSLEHYLTAVLPFGGRHRDALVNLRTMVPDRLGNNARLQRALASGTTTELTEEMPGARVPTIALPFDSDRLHRLFAYIVRGLLWHHWRVTLTADHDAVIMSLTKFGESTYSQFLGMNARNRVRADIGGGTFLYEGAQGTDYPEFSIWAFCIYGGVKLSGDPTAPQEEVSRVGAITASKSFLRSPAFTTSFGLPGGTANSG